MPDYLKYLSALGSVLFLLHCPAMSPLLCPGPTELLKLTVSVFCFKENRRGDPNVGNMGMSTQLRLSQCQRNRCNFCTERNWKSSGKGSQGRARRMKGEHLVAPESKEVLRNRRGERRIYQLARAPTGQSWKNSSKVNNNTNPITVLIITQWITWIPLSPHWWKQITR